MQIISAANGHISASNGRLNYVSIENISSTYLVADAVYRGRKFLGDELSFVTGVDTEGNRLVEAAQMLGSSIPEITETFVTEFKRRLARFSIVPSHFVLPTQTYVDYLRKTAYGNLCATGYVCKGTVQVFVCSSCGRSLEKLSVGDNRNAKRKLPVLNRNLGDLSCRKCGSVANIRSSEEDTFLLSLDRRSRFLNGVIERHEGTAIANLLNSIFHGDFLNWDFARREYQGPKIADEPNQYFYLWFSALVSKLAPFLDSGHTPIESDVSLQCFFSKSIVPYYSLVLPIVLGHGFHLNSLDLSLSIRGWCNAETLDQEMRFNFIDGTTQSLSSDFMRFFCLYQTPDDLRDYKFHCKNVTGLRKIYLKRFISPIYRRVKPELLAKAGSDLNNSNLRGTARALLLGGNIRQLLYWCERLLSDASSLPDCSLHFLAGLTRSILALPLAQINYSGPQ